MLPKPTGCAGCPAYDDGRGFVPDEWLPVSSTLILTSSPMRADEESGKPLVGAAGQLLNADYLPVAGLQRGSNVSVASVLKCRLRDPKTGLKSDQVTIRGKTLQRIVTHCTSAHLRRDVQANTLVLAMGDVAWQYASGGVGGLLDWRGFLAPTPTLGVPTLGVLSLDYLRRNRRLAIPAKRDWYKVQMVGAGVWPKAVPPCPNERDRIAYHEWFERALDAPYIVCDTEFTRGEKQLTLVGLGFPVGESVAGLQFRWLQSPQYQKQFMADYRNLVARTPVVFHNAMADLRVLREHLGVSYKDYLAVEDTMLAHAVLWAEWPHDLEFLASVYGQYPKLKHLSEVDNALYNWGDVLETDSIYRALQKEFKQDPASETIYRVQSLGLYQARIEAEDAGILVNKERVLDAITEYTNRLNAATDLATAYCGYPINLGSSEQLGRWLYQLERLPAQKAKGTKSLSIGEDAIATLRRKFYDFDPEDEKDGLTPEQVMRYVEAGAHPLLEARAMQAAAQQVLSHYLLPLVKEEYRAEHHTSFVA